MGYSMIDFGLLGAYWPNLVRGTIVTLEIAFIGCCIGITLGTLLGFAQAQGTKLVRNTVALYAALLRGTPMLIQIACAVFVLPQIGIHIPIFWAATLAIGFNSSAYLSQIIRAGIVSVDKGQIEAAYTLGFSYFQAMRFIVLPQALATVLPALGNEFITLIKDSSLASTVGVMELTKEASYIKNQTYDALTVYCLIAIMYLLLTTPLTLFVNHLEKRLNRHVNH
jgi:polar amino acid transport system permease protein